MQLDQQSAIPNNTQNTVSERYDDTNDTHGLM
jgi:hypothetical protein